MISTLRQLQDLKEWSQDSTRYERRLNFRLASKPYNWEEGDWWDLDDQSVGNTKILEDFEITDEMRRRPNAEGGVQQLVGTPTKEVTQYGRRIYETPEGEEVSERSTTFFIKDLGWINIPSIHGGRPFTDDQLRLMIKRGVIEPTSVHQSKLEAEEAAGLRSNLMKRHEKGFAGGQLVQPGPGRPGYSGNIMTGSPAQQAANIKAQKETWNKIGDALWKASETGEMEYLMNSPELQKKAHKGKVRYNKGMIDGTMRNAWSKLSTNENGLRHIAKTFNMDVDHVLDLMEEAKDFSDESRQLTWKEKNLAKSSKIRDQFAKGEKWMMDNATRFDDPAKFKAAYIKRFGRGNAFIKAIKNNTASFFSPNFNFELMGAKGLTGETSKLSKTLGDNIFSSVIYNMNPEVRKSITNEFKRALTGDVPSVKYQARKILTQSPLLKKFGLDKQIHGPISRLIFKEVGDKMYKNIQTFRNPKVDTWGFLNYLEDVVDPKYKTQFAEARKAVDYARRNKWKDAKKVLNIADNINWDHKIPSFLIDAGYADELEYIKLQPTTQDFNMKIKNKQFDIPMAKLMKEYENAPASQKGNVITKMQDKIDDFSRKYGGYMEGVKVTPDKTGKPIFTSQAAPLTKKTDVVKLLKESVKQQKFKPPISGGQALHSFPANIPGMFKKLSPFARKALGWTGADIGFYYLDKWNEMSKGKSEKEAAGIALNNATLGLYKNKTYIEGLEKTAKEMGIDSRAFENVYNMNEKMAKVYKEHERYQGMIEKLKKREASPERDRTLASIENAYKNWEESMEPEIDKWIQGIVDDISISKTGGIASPLELSKAAGSITDDEWYGAFGNLQKASLEKLRQEKAAAYDRQSRQVDPEAGKIGNILNIFPFSLSPLERAKEQGRIDDMVAFDPKELYRYNLARGLDPDAPITQAAEENLMYEHPGLGFNKGGRVSYLDGGIVSLLKK